MKKVRIAHGIGGVFILTGILLSIYVNQNWLWLSAFVGANMLVHSATDFCMMMKILDRLGVKESEGVSCRS